MKTTVSGKKVVVPASNALGAN